MPFIPAAVFDSRSADLWRRFGLEPGFDAEALLDSLELSLLWDTIDEGDGERVLGALLARDRRVVLNDRHLAELETNHGLRRFTIAHEVGHWLLHADAARSGTIPLDHDGRTWCRSGATEPAERQAEMFAGRLLIPRDRLLAILPASRWAGWPRVYELAERFVVTATAMVVRLEELELAHRDAGGVPRSGKLAPLGQGVLFPD
jgi:hypothetical protein